MAMSKLSDREFLIALRKSAGLFFRTVKIIEKDYGVVYTRQAVFQRAKRFKDELHDIREQNKDVAEEVIQSTMRSENEGLAYRAALDYLKYNAKDRGYVDRTEMDLMGMNEIIVKGKKPSLPPVEKA